jgi:excisionase family DNA binding protein
MVRIPLPMALAPKAILGGIDSSRHPAGNEEASEPTLVACVVFRTQDPDQLVELLREALTGIVAPAPAVPMPSPMPQFKPDSEDPWLRHTEAAAYLGISKSTLYRYAEQQRIESRKLGNRLEYRRSSLDRFKDQHVRPARRPPRARGIIVPALSSGN